MLLFVGHRVEQRAGFNKNLRANVGAALYASVTKGVTL